MLRSDPLATAARLQALTAYMGANVLSPAGEDCGAFVCPSAAGCHASVPGADYSEAQLSHVGEHYDLWDGDRPLRIVLVGQEYGHGPGRVGLDSRRLMVLRDSGTGRTFSGGGSYPARNPHMRGTTQVLRMLLGGEPGADREGEFVELASGERAHAFDCFALVNVLLCSATETGTTIGVSSATMRRNCLPHFEATLRVLDPTVVVLQGSGVTDWTSSLFEPSERVGEHLWRFQWGERPTYLARFSHPTARGSLRWSNLDSPYLRDAVVPTLRQVTTDGTNVR